MAGTRFTTQHFIGGLLFFLVFIPVTRSSGGVLYLAPPPPDKNTEYFNVLLSGVRWEVAYRRLIELLRNELSSGHRWGRSGVPVLPPQARDGQPPTRWFHLVLYNDTTSITVRIRGDNLYVVAFQRGGSDQWWECKKDDGKEGLIKDSNPLGFSCNYQHIERTARTTTSTIQLGQQALADAVSALGDDNDPSTTRQQTAESMLVIILMISEATRFRNIADLFMRQGPAPPRLSEEMSAHIRAWEDISEHMFRADQYPTDRNAFPLRVQYLGIQFDIPTPSAAALLIGILLLPRNCPWLWGPVGGGGGDTGAGHCAEGRPLMEVFSVVINDIDGEDPGHLFGTINVTDGLGRQSIYGRDQYNYEKVSPREAATLTGPADRAISALGSITVDLDLWDRDFSAFNPNDQVSKGSVEWDHLDLRKRYNTRLSQRVAGQYGSATVNYVVFSDAVAAKFDVTLVRGNDGQQDEVYGRIVARIGDLGIESVLLSTTSSNYVQVWYGSRIPLQRTIVTVPLSSYIRVSALLYDYDSSSADDEIAGGCTYFGAKSFGTTRWRITGLSGEIEVKVTWNPSF